MPDCWVQFQQAYRPIAPLDLYSASLSAAQCHRWLPESRYFAVRFLFAGGLAGHVSVEFGFAIAAESVLSVPALVLPKWLVPLIWLERFAPGQLLSMLHWD